LEIVDLSMEIYPGMPVYKGMPEVKIEVHSTHEAWDNIIDPSSETPSVHSLQLSEHTGTHVDSISHMGREFSDQSIDKMPLSTFYTEGICLDFSHKNLRELIEPNEIELACQVAKVKIEKGDTILFYTDHYRKHFDTEDWKNGPGLSANAAIYLGEKDIAGFGVETMSPGVSKISNKDVHKICGLMGFTHYENLINMHHLIGRGRFRFIAFPLKIRCGTGSPVRAVAIF
jgi:kynurenine formamidase